MNDFLYIDQRKNYLENVKIPKVILKKDEEDIMNIDPKSSVKAKMSCGHSFSSEGMTQNVEFCVR